MDADLHSLQSRIRALKKLGLKAVERIDLPVPAAAAWRVLGDPRRLPEMSNAIQSVDLLPSGYRMKFAGGSSVAIVECEVPEVGNVGLFTDDTMLGLKLPAAELQGFWTLIEPAGDGVSVEMGRAFSFRNRLAAQAGRMLPSINRRFLSEILSGAERLLSPGGGLLEVPLLTQWQPPEGEEQYRLDQSDAARLREAKLLAHKSAAAASAFMSGASDPLAKGLGRAGVKAAIAHADRSVRRRDEQLVGAGDWPDLLGRLGKALDPFLAAPISEFTTRSLVAPCRAVGLSTPEELLAGSGVAAFGLAVGELESMTYGARYSRRARKLVRALEGLTDRPPEGRIAEGALAIADNRSIDRASATVMDLPGFSSLVREVLAVGAGATVDASPDLRNGRPRSVRKKTQILFNVGLATDAILAIAGASSASWLPPDSTAYAVD